MRRNGSYAHARALKHRIEKRVRGRGRTQRLGRVHDASATRDRPFAPRWRWSTTLAHAFQRARSRWVSWRRSACRCPPFGRRRSGRRDRACGAACSPSRDRASRAGPRNPRRRPRPRRPSVEGPTATRMSAERGLACRTVFVSASCTTRSSASLAAGGSSSVGVPSNAKQSSRPAASQRREHCRRSRAISSSARGRDRCSRRRLGGRSTRLRACVPGA